MQKATSSAGDLVKAAAPSSPSLTVQDCAAYIAQLKSLLSAAVTQPPPPGVTTAEVERRMALIEAALNDVEQYNESIRAAQELNAARRFAETQHRRITAEREAEARRASTEKERKEQLERIHDMRVTYYRSQNEKDEAKSLQCKSFSEKVMLDTLQKGEDGENRRMRNLEKLKAKREHDLVLMRENEAARQAHARGVNRRRSAERKRAILKRQHEVELHAKEVEMKLAAIRESRRSKWVAKSNANRAKAIVNWNNGQALLETKLKDHEKLLEELETKERQQQARYAEEKETQLAYLRQRHQLQSLKQTQLQNNLLRLIDERVNRGDKILENSKKKNERGNLTKKIQALQYTASGNALRQEVFNHRKQAEQLEEHRQTAALQKNYRRWNHRAARIMDELNNTFNAASAGTTRAEDQVKPLTKSSTFRFDQQQLHASDHFLRFPSSKEFET